MQLPNLQEYYFKLGSVSNQCSVNGSAAEQLDQLLLQLIGAARVGVNRLPGLWCLQRVRESGSHELSLSGV